MGLQTLPSTLPLWLLAVGCGGLVGTIINSRYLPDVALRRVLAMVLLVSGAKLILI